MAKKKGPFLPPAVANTDAMGTAERAAAAVGLSVAELCNLIVDNGIAAVPPDGGMTQKYTLEDLGKKLWVDLQGRPRAERAKFFKGLSEPQRGALIVQLRNAGYATPIIAMELGIAESTVTRTYHAYASDVGSQVVGIRLDTIAGQLTVAAERAQQMAMQSGDHKAFWAIHRDYLKALQSIGIVDSAIQRVEVTHKIEDAHKVEIDALVALEAKKNAAKAIAANAKDAEFDVKPQHTEEPEDD